MDYTAKEIKPHEREKLHFDTYGPVELESIVDKQSYLKSQGHTNMFHILVVVDDFADSPEFTRQSKLLQQFYIRGRHQCISTTTSTQVDKVISPIVRKNLTHLFVFRLRNAADVKAWIEELSAVYDKKTLHQLYSLATEAPHSSLYIKLIQKDKTNIFYIQFSKI